MEGILKQFTSPESITLVGPVLLLFTYVAYKEWPDLKKRISDSVLKDKRFHDTDENLTLEVRELRLKVTSIEEKLANDFARINNLERESDQMRKLAENSLEERRLLMKCNLAQLKALKELGANGTTGVKEAEEELQIYLNSKAHNWGFIN